VSLFRTKSIEASMAAADEPDHHLKRRLTALDLVVFGVGVVIGAGIFTVTGRAAQQYAGPSVILSFILAAIVCALAAMCYAEFASTVPVSGSAYTFSYATLGELVAWIIGWDLILELMLGASVVAQGWSAYVQILLGRLGVEVPAAVAPGSHFDLGAFLLVAVLALLVARGIKESLRVNLVLVAIKVFIVLFVIVAGIGFVDSANWSPFIPPSAANAPGAEGIHAPVIQVITGMTPATYGVMGIMSAAALVFFAYIGFDVVATTAEEAQNPQRDLPIGILGSLAICTALYVAVALVITGMLPYDQINPQGALAAAFEQVGEGGYATLISAGAVAGLTTVVMTLIIGTTRVVFAMSRDRLLPAGLGVTSEKTGTPVRLTFLVAGIIALVASLTPIGRLEEMVNIGTLSAFVLVSLAVPILRRNRPELKRGFKVPFSPFLPWLSALLCVYLILNLSIETWIRFLIWMGAGMIIYFAYSRTHSRLATGAPEAGLEGTPQMLDVD
jgi:APA family basic amino acid/polyamine antiporter